MSANASTVEIVITLLNYVDDHSECNVSCGMVFVARTLAALKARIDTIYWLSMTVMDAHGILYEPQYAFSVVQQ